MRNALKYLPLFAAIGAFTLIFIIGIGKNLYASFQVQDIQAKIIKKEAQMMVEKKRTYYRYLIITDKETFVVEKSIIQGSFNTSDIFYHIQEGQNYTLTVQGVGKSLFTDYKNIIGVSPPHTTHQTGL
jgi:hypothetical protein